MVRSINRLTAVGVQKIKAKGRYADGGGLYMRVSPALNKSWVFRSIRDGVATELGFGRYPDVSLADARQVAVKMREHVAAGRNPKTPQAGQRWPGSAAPAGPGDGSCS